MTQELDAAALATRERFGAAFQATVLASSSSGLTLRTAQELEDLRRDVLRRQAPGSDLHVFGYGSLMWNPALEHSGQWRARVHGWHRSFCIRSVVGRGTPATPGLMLALDRGGSCNGMLFRIPAAKVQQELALLWRREMTWGTYDARWVTAWLDGAPLPALTFVVNRGHERYVSGMAPAEAARLINTGGGSLGTCRAYFEATLQKLRELGIHDARMEQLHAGVRGANPPPPGRDGAHPLGHAAQPPGR